MNPNEKLSIRVNIADRFYPLKVERKDEEKIRLAAKMINEKVQQYRKRYSDKDIQDVLAMTALQFVTKVIECEQKNTVTPLLNQLKDLDKELGEYIEKV